MRLAVIALIALLASATFTGCREESDPDATPAPPEATATPENDETPAATATATPTANNDEPSDEPLSATLEVALEGRVFERPTEVGAWPGEVGGLFVAEQSGIVYLFRDGGEEVVLLDIRERVLDGGLEEGLLSLEPDPAFEDNGHVWLYYNPAAGERRTVLARYTLAEGDPSALDPASELVVLEVPQPFQNHNGGAIRFGPDGMLYLGLGDGGSAGDPQGHGQDLGTLLGSLVRIDVRNATEAQPYAVPDDNPFLDDPGAMPETWAYGLRNPWRMAFDTETGDLWLTDAGQNRVEAIYRIEAGANYGWNVVEGDVCFEPAEDCPTDGITDPVLTYRIDGEPHCVIVGAAVYRGGAVPGLDGHFLFADWCSGVLWAVDVDAPGEAEVVGQELGMVTSLGTGPDGEVYVLAWDQPLRRVVAAEGGLSGSLQRAARTDRIDAVPRRGLGAR